MSNITLTPKEAQAAILKLATFHILDGELRELLTLIEEYARFAPGKQFVLVVHKCLEITELMVEYEDTLEAI